MFGALERPMFGALDRPTTLITILSTAHGRMRREQRDISMRDLQKALKYGRRSRAWKGRWLIEYDGIIFISDPSMRKEITCYPSPLAEAVVSAEDIENHNKTKEVVDHKPELCSTHTVLVVDNSGSMTKHDIDLYRCRQTAAYTMTALEFVAEQIFNGTATNRDLFSLVEFNKTSSVHFTREPLGWVLFNKILKRRDNRNFEERERDQTNDVLYSNSNYFPALDDAEKILDTGNHETCALNLYFLSDGAPTDARHLGLTPQAVKRKLGERMAEIATRFGKQLNVQFVGFGSSFSDFSTLEYMTADVNEAPGEAKANFLYCEKMANQLRTAASSLIASSTLTRTSLMQDQAARGTGKSRHTLRRIQSEKDAGVRSGWLYYRILQHFVFNSRTQDFQRFSGLPFGSIRDHTKREAERRERHPPNFLAIKSAHCGMGAERVAYRCHLADEHKKSGTLEKQLVFDPMVAKETKMVERVAENVTFHKAFLKTQHLAQHLANEFNKRIRGLPDYNKQTTPKISFLQCSVLLVEDKDWPDGKRGFLVEKMMDTTKFEWRKWNDNAGGVNGVMAPIDVAREYAKIKGDQTHEVDPFLALGIENVPITALGEMGAIEEGDSEEESDDDNSDSKDEAEAEIQLHEFDSSSESDDEKSAPSEFLQAFTHFSYMHTARKVMVCDLQGVYNTDMVPPTFELSDPAIHYASKNGREAVYGHTDGGQKGMQLFLKTHKCSPICKFMRLGRVNRRWREKWQKEARLLEETDNLKGGP